MLCPSVWHNKWGTLQPPCHKPQARACPSTPKPIQSNGMVALFFADECLRRHCRRQVAATTVQPCNRPTEPPATTHPGPWGALYTYIYPGDFIRSPMRTRHPSATACHGLPLGPLALTLGWVGCKAVGWLRPVLHFAARAPFCAECVAGKVATATGYCHSLGVGRWAMGDGRWAVCGMPGCGRRLTFAGMMLQPQALTPEDADVAAAVAAAAARTVVSP